MIKICFVATVAFSLRTFLLKTAEALHETGEFDIYFMANPNAQIEKEFPEYIHFIPIPMKRGIGLDAFSAIRKMKKVFLKEKFDMVQYFTPNASCYASIAAKSANVPVRLYTQWGLVYVGFSGIKRCIFKMIEKMICKNSTWIEVENRANLEFSHKEGLYPEEIGTVVWNGSASGVSLEKYNIDKKAEWRQATRSKLGISENDFVFGFCGRQNKDKGLNELLQATKEIMEDNANVHLLLIGSSIDAKTLNADLFGWAQKHPRVHFTGRVSNTEEYYAALDCYTMPSYREGFGMTVIEAGSMGVPVVISDIVGHKDTMIPDVTGICVEPKNYVALRDAMKLMMTDEAKRREMGAQGRKYVEQHYEQKQLLSKIVEARRKLAHLI